MQLKVINSNSLGNAYILDASNGEALLIECGVNFTEIKTALNFNLRKVAGCLVTHEHGDHSKGINDVLKAGIKVYASAGTHEATGTTAHHNAVIIEKYKSFRVGTFLVQAFKIQHDVKDPVGFIIFHPECGTVLFLTDSYYCEHKFTGLNNILIEANYCQSIIDNRVKDTDTPKFLRDRVLQSHMSLATCKRTLSSYDLSAVNNIVLIHLSNGNSDECRFKLEVEQQTGKLVHVAGPGLTIPFNQKFF